MNNLKLLLILAIVCFMVFTVSGQDKVFKYIGAQKCKTCHNSEKSGKQFDIWAKSLHAEALKSLANEKSLKYAKENGIADPTKDAKCLNCHSTYAMVDKGLVDPQGKLTLEEGVTCEACHGPGSEYKTMAIMKDPQKSKANGLIEPTEQVCLRCHNEKNPFHKPFNFKEAVAKIAHPKPQAAK
jgi:hypothetical protein